MPRKAPLAEITLLIKFSLREIIAEEIASDRDQTAGGAVVGRDQTAGGAVFGRGQTADGAVVGRDQTANGAVVGRDQTASGAMVGRDQTAGGTVVGLPRHWEMKLLWYKIQSTQEIKRTLFNWTKQDKTCKFWRKSSFSSYVQHYNRKTNN